MNVSKRSPRLYQVVVNTPKGGAGHFVTTYELDQNGKYIGFDYKRFTYTLDDSAHSPNGDSFREQLRALDEAHDAAEIPRGEEESRIQEMMKEAYGGDSNIDISQLTFDF